MTQTPQTEQQQPQKPRWLAPENLARVAFVVLMFFVFFGTSMPFQKKLSSADEITTSNVFSQLVFSAAYLLGGIALFAKRREFLHTLRQEKFLALFLLWCLLSIAWSDFPVTSFKRWVQIFGPYIVFSAILLHSDSPNITIELLRKILMIYLPLSLLSVLFVYEATEWQFPAWRGLAPSKNWLGQITLVSTLVWAPAVLAQHGKKRLLGMAFFGMSVILLLGSRSATSNLTFFFIAGAALLMAIDRRFATLGIGRSFTFVLIFSVSLSLLATAWFGFDVKDAFFDLIGKDLTFTERFFLWQDIIRIAREHWLFGCGYNGFWVVENKAVLALYETFIWLPNQAHEGYLDLLNEVGVVGTTSTYTVQRELSEH